MEYCNTFLRRYNRGFDCHAEDVRVNPQWWKEREGRQRQTERKTERGGGEGRREEKRREEKRREEKRREERTLQMDWGVGRNGKRRIRWEVEVEISYRENMWWGVELCSILGMVRKLSKIHEVDTSKES
jgi:hypothetical protein